MKCVSETLSHLESVYGAHNRGLPYIGEIKAYTSFQSTV